MLALAAANRLRLSTAASSTPSTTLSSSVMETPPHPIPTVSTPVVPRRRQAMMTSASSSSVESLLATTSPKDDFKDNTSSNSYKKGGGDYDNAGDKNATLWFWSTPVREGVMEGKGAATATDCTTTGGSEGGVRKMPTSVSQGSGKHKVVPLPSERTRPQTRPWPELGLNGPGR